MTRRYLLDSGPLGAALDGREAVLDRVEAARRSGARVGTCVPIVAELYYGAEKSHHPDESVRELDLGLTDYVIWPFDLAAAKRFARIKAALKRKGITMQDADLQLAAVALTLGSCTVVSADSDLSRVPGLAVENWAN